MVPASYLYVPGDRPERFAKALSSGAGGVVLDLEDAVALAAKADARAAVVDQLMKPAAIELWVRVNSGDLGRADVEAVADLPGLTGVFVPKATVASLEDLRAITDVPCCALVESAVTLLELPKLAAADGVVALAMGEVDLAADLGLEPSPNEHEMWPLRMQVVVASVAAGRRAPIGPVHTSIHDLDELRHSTLALRRAGFEARQAIHPTQVSVINEAMTPTEEEVERAEELLRLADAADGGVCVDEHGRMIDEAVLRSARRSLDRRRAIEPN